MSATIHIKSDRSTQVTKQFHDAVNQVVRKTTFDVEAGAKRLAPVDTGLLRNSIQSAMVGDLTGVVFTHTEYAPFLEYGTRKMSARPFMTPALEAERHAFIAALQAIGRNVK